MPKNLNSPLLLCASQRRGNCLAAAGIFASGFKDASDKKLKLELSRLKDASGEGLKLEPSSLKDASGELEKLKPTLLAEFRIEPCIACGICSKGESCPFLSSDDSAKLLDAFLHAPLIAIFSPIYFYHLPAHLKALLDRCQQYYMWRELGIGGLDKLPQRKAFIVLTGAREQGKQLFSGSLLTLKLALASFNISLMEPILLYGLDEGAALSKRPDYQKTLYNYGVTAGQSLNDSGDEPEAPTQSLNNSGDNELMVPTQDLSSNGENIATKSQTLSDGGKDIALARFTLNNSGKDPIQ